MTQPNHGTRSNGTQLAIAIAAILSAASAFAHAVAPADGGALQEVVVTGKKLQLKSLRQKSIYQSAYADKALDR